MRDVIDYTQIKWIPEFLEAWLECAQCLAREAEQASRLIRLRPVPPQFIIELGVLARVPGPLIQIQPSPPKSIVDLGTITQAPAKCPVQACRGGEIRIGQTDRFAPCARCRGTGFLNPSMEEIRRAGEFRKIKNKFNREQEARREKMMPVKTRKAVRRGG